MKKLSVNGNTFEEIFGQTGKTVKPLDMVRNKAYLTYGEFYWLFYYSDIYNKLVHTGFVLCEDGETDNEASFHITRTFHEATPDQIALLEAYRLNA